MKPEDTVKGDGPGEFYSPVQQELHAVSQKRGKRKGKRGSKRRGRRKGSR